MERALCDVFTASADNQKNGNDYSALSPLQLATEVQKLNGYNHFSKSTSMLLAEVVSRLVIEHRVANGDTRKGRGGYARIISHAVSVDYHDVVTLGFYAAVRKQLVNIPNIDVELYVDQARKTDWQNLLGVIASDPRRHYLHLNWSEGGAIAQVMTRRSIPEAIGA